MKVAGIWSGHDCSFCILENGQPIIHAEFERYNREKSPPGDSIDFLLKRYKDSDQITHFASVYPTKKTYQYKESYEEAKRIIEKNGGTFNFFSHHKSHAANAFYSSNFDKATVITIDGGGVEDENDGETACTIWYGDGNKLNHVKTFSPLEINVGGPWTRVTRYVFKLQNGWPRGGQEGSIMAMAAFGDPDKYLEDCWRWLTADKLSAGFKPPDQPFGAYIPGKDPVHPYLEPWAQIASRSEQDRFDIAASLQKATEKLLGQIVNFAIEQTGYAENICLAGGVTLNSVAMGKLKKWQPKINNIYIPPVPYDGGLSIGAAQLVWHETLGNPRIEWEHNFTPYLGEVWAEDHFKEMCEKFENKILLMKGDDLDVANLLSEGNIVSVFNGKSESGRRALGNRSILADPRNPDMKNIINEKVKHRQWFRPFAPSILEEKAEEWFLNYIESPYMQFVLEFREDKGSLVPAVNHKDGTARLQTVRPTDNPWYHNFLTLWESVSGVPIILNTSFNDREPICENIEHAINCYLGTQIDYLYLPEHSTLIKRNEG